MNLYSYIYIVRLGDVFLITKPLKNKYIMEFYPGFEVTEKRKYTKRNTFKKMTELETWQLVNQAETRQTLAFIINKLADPEGMIQGRSKKFDASKMIIGLNLFMEDTIPANVLTREFGIRQQAIYLKTFKN
jgi:serine/threonine protein kinase